MNFMKEALKEAKKAYDKGEVPIGAVVVKDGEIIGRGHNRRETDKNALYHAEVIAINDACKNLGGWRLPDTEIYVTLEPCPMCMGAIISARIDKLYYGAKDEKSGAAGSVADLSKALPHKVSVTSGVLEDECSKIIKSFFKELRISKTQEVK